MASTNEARTVAMAADAVAGDDYDYELDEHRPPPPSTHPNVENLVTEDDTPVDNIFSEKQQRLLTEPLYSSWRGPHDDGRFVALANVGMFFAVEQSPYVPDMLLSVDVDLPKDLKPKGHRSYFFWLYGKPPEAVVEVVSNRDGGEDSAKLDGYAQLGIISYVIFDPYRYLSDQTLRVYMLTAGRYEPVDVRRPFELPKVKLGLRLWDGVYENRQATWLRWTNADGELVPTGAERAAQQSQRAERLAEQLRKLGIDPDVVASADGEDAG